jgi:hypothetical protein
MPIPNANFIVVIVVVYKHAKVNFENTPQHACVLHMRRKESSAVGRPTIQGRRTSVKDFAVMMTRFTEGSVSNNAHSTWVMLDRVHAMNMVDSLGRSKQCGELHHAPR